MFRVDRLKEFFVVFHGFNVIIIPFFLSDRTRMEFTISPSSFEFMRFNFFLILSEKSIFRKVRERYIRLSVGE